MAIFGSNINPALGRVDYSPIAQGMAMGGQLAAQGLTNMGQGIAKGVELYAQNREKNALLEGRNAALLRQFQNDPSLKQFAPDPKSLDSLMAKMSKGGGLTLNDNIKLNAELQTTVDAAEKSRETQLKQIYAEQARSSVNKMAYDLDQAKKTDEAWGRYSELSRGFTKDTTYDEKVKAVAEAGLPPEAASRALGNVINAEQLGLARERAALDKRLADQKLKEEAANSDFLADVRNGKKPGYRVDDVNGVPILVDTVRGVSTQITTAKPPPEQQGSKLRAEAFKYHSSLAAGDEAGAAEHLANARKLTAGQGFENYEDPEFAEKVFGPFRGDLRASLDKPSEGLEVKGEPKPVSAKPPPTAEDQKITEQPNIQGKSFYQMGTQFKGPGGVTGRTYSDAEVAEQQRRMDLREGRSAAPAPTQTQPAVAAPTQAPTPPPAPRPPVQDIVLPPKPPAQDIIIPPSLPTQDIILDDSLVRRPGASGSFNAYRSNKEVASDDYEFGARGYSYLPKPGEKLNATQGAPILNRMEGELKLSKARLELLEPKAKDSSDTLALKKIIPYLPNKALSMRLLKELSEGKQPSLSALNKDPFARSMLAAAKEGRLPQLNMAAVGRS